MQVQERVIGCFKALATGDAVGKQTQTVSRADVLRWYPGGIAGFHGQPGEVIPRYAGKRYEWRIGETTDDTEQTLAVTRALLREARASQQAIGQELLQCRNLSTQACHCGPSCRLATRQHPNQSRDRQSGFSRRRMKSQNG